MRPRVFLRRRGVALILVLGFIATLALLMTGLMATLRVRLVEGERREQADLLRLDADSALAAAMARLAVFRMDGRGAYLNEADLAAMAAEPLAGRASLSGGEVTVRFRDESAYFPLNTTDTAALRLLFEDVGAPEERAMELADALADWIDADESARLAGAEAEAYGVPGRPANRPLRRFAELREVKGFAEVFFDASGAPNDLGRRLAEVVTLLSAEPKPNVNTAPEPVLRLLAVRSGADVGAMLAFRTPLDYPNERRHAGVFESAGRLALVDAPSAFAERVSYATRRLRVSVTVTKGELAYVTEALLEPAPGASKAPVTVRARVDAGTFDDLR